MVDLKLILKYRIQDCICSRIINVSVPISFMSRYHGGTFMMINLVWWERIIRVNTSKGSQDDLDGQVPGREEHKWSGIKAWYDHLLDVQDNELPGEIELDAINKASFIMQLDRDGYASAQTFAFLHVQHWKFHWHFLVILHTIWLERPFYHHSLRYWSFYPHSSWRNRLKWPPIRRVVLI